jgi:hypothetical protein
LCWTIYYNLCIMQMLLLELVASSSPPFLGGFFCKIFMGGMLPVIFCNFFVVRLTNLLQNMDCLRGTVF